MMARMEKQGSVKKIYKSSWLHLSVNILKKGN